MYNSRQHPSSTADKPELIDEAKKQTQICAAPAISIQPTRTAVGGCTNTYGTPKIERKRGSVHLRAGALGCAQTIVHKIQKKNDDV